MTEVRTCGIAELEAPLVPPRAYTDVSTWSPWAAIPTPPASTIRPGRLSPLHQPRLRLRRHHRRRHRHSHGPERTRPARADQVRLRLIGGRWTVGPRSRHYGVVSGHAGVPNPDASVLCVAQIVAVHSPALSDPAKFGCRLPLGVPVPGVLVGLAEPTTLPASGRSTGHDGHLRYSARLGRRFDHQAQRVAMQARLRLLGRCRYRLGSLLEGLLVNSLAPGISGRHFPYAAPTRTACSAG
jgi:hypothetical protein